MDSMVRKSNDTKDSVVAVLTTKESSQEDNLSTRVNLLMDYFQNFKVSNE